MPVEHINCLSVGDYCQYHTHTPVTVYKVLWTWSCYDNLAIQSYQQVVNHVAAGIY